MKKIILTLVIATSFTACKKSELAEAQNALDTIDSAATELSQHSESIDSVVSSVKDSVNTKIHELEEQKKNLSEKLDKKMDSTTEKIKSIDLNISKKTDSVKEKHGSANEKTKHNPEKIIKETKIIYHEKPNYQTFENQETTIKKGSLEFNVQNLSDSQQLAKENIAKYDGIIKSEQISAYNGQEYDFIKVRVSEDKFEYLIEDLIENVGDLKSKNIEIIGTEHSGNRFCNLEITLYETSKNNPQKDDETTKSFGSRSGDAISKGWNVIKEIFLFLLPFWPLFLIGGSIYYYFKKKKNTDENIQNKSSEEDKP